jgi:hypothetical protein
VVHRTITVFAYFNILKEPAVFIEEPTTSRQMYDRLFEKKINDIFENRGYY